MRIFLKVDIGIQTLLFLTLLAGIFGSLLKLPIAGGLFLFFIFMGIWQPVSSLIHLLLDFSKERAFYLASAIGYACLMPIIADLNIAIPLYFFGAVCLSVWYFRINYLHLKRLENVSHSFWDLA